MARAAWDHFVTMPLTPGPDATLGAVDAFRDKTAMTTTTLDDLPPVTRDVTRLSVGVAVVLIAHAKIEKFENPETVPYDRYSPRLHKLASALVQEWVDEVLFATYKVHTVKVDEGFNKAKHNGVGTGERIIRTVERPAHVAKNRLGLPEELPLDFRVYGAFARGENPFAEPVPASPGAAPAGDAPAA